MRTAPVTRLPGSASWLCFAAPHSPWPRPFAPRAPQQPRPPCSLASALLRAGPTSPSGSSSATASGLPDNVPATTDGDGDGDLPVPEQKASAHARVYDDAGPACVLRYRHRAVLPSVGRKTSAPRTCLMPLNTSPAHSPVNAAPRPSRPVRRSLGAGAARYAFTPGGLPPPTSRRSPGTPSLT
jgi:hypothetical protein